MGNQTPLVKQVETLNYRSGGFHPVHLGDHFKKDRYSVVHKLGHGGFATVWLARDQVRQRYVALKILASRLSRDCPEVEILRRLRSSPDHSGKPYVMSLLDHFWIYGPNGKHLCVVSEVGGPSIRQFNDCPGQSSGTRRLRASVARKVALQATEGLAYIHLNGIVHGGIHCGILIIETSTNHCPLDFTSSNILLQLANIDEWLVEQVHERLGEPETQDLSPAPARTPESSRPRYTVRAIDMKEVQSRWLSDQIIIIDFGIAFLQEQSSPDIGTPKIYCAPEFLFGEARSVSSDIWALGCTLFEIRTGTSLFRYKGRPSRDQTLIAMVRLLGDLPERWWSEWEKGHTWYQTELEDGGELAENLPRTLYHQITEIGSHDGAYQTVDSSHKDLSLERHSVEESEKIYTSREDGSNNTSRLIALVGELTTSDAADVIARANQSTSDLANGDKFKSSSTSSNAKSTEKSISSEGISTGVGVTNSVRRVNNVIGTEASGVVGSVKDATATTTVEEFLEPVGTVISAVEAKGLENLLRKTLSYLPEQRLAPSELAKHHWFFDDFEANGVNQ
jgi:serine/threonine-protein kinase SRPK3